jgi:hypothetical protein
MNLESKATGLTTPDEVDNRTPSESQPKESAPPARAGGLLKPEPGPEQPYVRGETFVMEGTRAAAGPADLSRAPEAPSTPALPQNETAVPLFGSAVAEEFRSRWNEIQVAFVDEPRDAVGRADRLVADTIKHLAESFAAERQKLEGEWDRGGDADTEALRLALRRYRSFFNRLLSV